MDMNGALPMHKSAERKDKESNVGTATALIDVKSSDVFMVVDVVPDEGCSCRGVKDVVVWSG